LAISKTGLAVFRENSARTGTQKSNLANTAVCLAWTSDGMKFAIGFENGSISFRDKDNEKETKNLMLNSDYQERIWCITFSATRYKNREYVFIAGTWAKNLYFYEVILTFKISYIIIQ
jgi:hypothetical protein